MTHEQSQQITATRPTTQQLVNEPLTNPNIKLAENSPAAAPQTRLSGLRPYSWPTNRPGPVAIRQPRRPNHMIHCSSSKGYLRFRRRLQLVMTNGVGTITHRRDCKPSLVSLSLILGFFSLRHGTRSGSVRSHPLDCISNIDRWPHSTE